MKQFRLQVKTELEALVEVLQWFELTAHSFLPPKCLWECKLALAEGFTNTVRYAHRDLPPVVPIIIDVEIALGWLEIKIWDIGPPFDLQAKLEELYLNSPSPLEKESDRGLFFMAKLTDALDYIRIANRRNCLIMRKIIKS